MKPKQVVLLSLVVLCLVCLGIWLVRISPRHPHLAYSLERSFPGIVPSSLYVRNLYSHNPDLMMSTFYHLSQRRDPIGADRAVELLSSEDDYVWLNSAEYLGACKRPEATPYLIKALRHTASRSDKETVDYLKDITGKDFGIDFSRWQQWWLSNHPGFEFDWTSHLGFSPRTPEHVAKHLKN